MPEVKEILDGLKQEVKTAHEELQQAAAEMKQYNERVEKLEKTKGKVPESVQTALDQVSAAVEGMDAKHTSISETIETLEAKMVEALSSEDVVNAEAKKLDAQHSREFKEFIKRGAVGEKADSLVELQKKAMYTGSDPDGGFAVPRPMSNMIIEAMKEATPFRREAATTTISGDVFKYLIDIDDVDAGWVAERESRSETSTPKIHPASINVHEMAANPALTQTMLDDAAFNVESWLAGKVANKFSEIEAEAFLLGNGNGKPRGLLTYATGNSWGQIEQIASGAAAGLTADALMDLQDALKEKYASGAKWNLNRRTLSIIRKLKDSTGQYLWQPGLQAGQPSTLLGDQIVRMNYMPTVGAGNLAIAYGDLKKAYLIVDRQAIRVLRDPYTKTPYVLFKTNARVGGDVVNFEAIKLMKVGV